MSTEMIVTLTISLFSFGLLLAPTFRNNLDSVFAGDGSEQEALYREKERMIQRLRDIESDYSAGTLEEDVYHRERDGVRKEIALILSQLDHTVLSKLDHTNSNSTIDKNPERRV